MTVAARRRWLGGIVLAAIAVRAAFALVFLQHPVGDIVPMDTEPYRALARAIAGARLDAPELDYLNPPYAFLLAPFTALPAPADRAAVVALQILLDAAVVGLTYALAMRLLSPAAALGAAALYAVYGTAVFYSATVLPVTTSVVAFVLALVALAAAPERGPRAWLVAGAAFGLFLLARPNGVVLLPLVVWWMKRAPWRRSALLVPGLVLVLLPFSVRSLRMGHGISPFPVNGGINFYIGNGPEAHGRYAHVPNVADRPGDQVRTSVEEASRRAGRTLDAREGSAFWFREGLTWMARNPRAAASLTLQKAGTFFRAEEPPLNVSYGFARRQIPLLRACVGLGLILPLALYGMAAAVLTRGSRPHPLLWLTLGAVFAYAAAVIAFFVSDRYRMPVVPLLAIFAAYGASTLADGPGPARMRRIGAIALAALFVNAPFTFFRYADDGLDHVKLSDAYIGRGDYDRAFAECEKAAAVSPDRPDTLFCFATAFYFKKDYFRAEMALRATIDAQAGTFSDVPARRNLAHVLKDQRRYEEAVREAADDEQRRQIRGEADDFKRRTADLGAYARAQHEKAKRRRAEGDLFEARAALHRAVGADPSLLPAWLDLAEVAGALRLGPEACDAARGAAAGAPGDTRARAAMESWCPPAAR